MDFQFSGQNVDLTEPLKEYAAKRIGKLRKFIPDSEQEEKEIHARVSFKVEGERQGVQVQLRGVGKFFKAESETPDLYASIDQVVDKLGRQLREHRERVTDHRKGESRKPQKLFASKVFRLDEEEEDGEPEIIRRETFNAKPMSPEEAVLQMKSLGYRFFVFTNRITDDINVVYERPDGNYGLIESQ